MAARDKFTNQMGPDKGMGLAPKKPAIRAEDVAEVRRGYDIPDLFKAKGKTDTETYYYSKEAVIGWWKKRKAAEARASAAAAAAAASEQQNAATQQGLNAPAPDMGEDVDPTMRALWESLGLGDPDDLTGPMLPDTAMGAGGASTLKSIPNTLPGKTTGQTAQLAANIQANQAAKMAPTPVARTAAPTQAKSIQSVQAAKMAPTPVARSTTTASKPVVTRKPLRRY